MQATLDLSERYALCEVGDLIVSVSCYVLFILLTICVSILIYKLRQLRDVVTQDEKEQKKMFNNEICTLVSLLVVFSGSYLLRGAWNEILTETNDGFTKLTI